MTEKSPKKTAAKQVAKPLTPAQIERAEKLKAKEKLARKKANIKAARERKKADEEAAEQRRLTSPMASCGWPKQDENGLTMPPFLPTPCG